MKFFAAIVLVAAVASATPVDRSRPSAIIGQILEAIAALKPEPVEVGPAIIDSESPISIGPAIVDTAPISIGPAIVDTAPISIGPAIIDDSEPIAVGPAWIDFPLPDGGAVTAPVEPSPVAVVPGPVSSEVAAGTPLVQIILNINQAPAVPEPVAVGPAVVPAIVPEPGHEVAESLPPINPIAVNPIGVVAPELGPAVIGVPVLPDILH